eukprot:5968348-Alexandrium_andersonii.AAC.1
MSASLVGSEMCIRDSSVKRRPPEMRRSPPPLSPWKGKNCRAEWPTGPVSYTHLTLPTICSV